MDHATSRLTWTNLLLILFAGGLLGMVTTLAVGDFVTFTEPVTLSALGVGIILFFAISVCISGAYQDEKMAHENLQGVFAEVSREHEEEIDSLENELRGAANNTEEISSKLADLFLLVREDARTIDADRQENRWTHSMRLGLIDQISDDVRRLLTVRSDLEAQLREVNSYFEEADDTIRILARATGEVDVDQIGSDGDTFEQWARIDLLDSIVEEVSELRTERDALDARVRELEGAQSPAEACREERDAGNGGCGACSICCGELRTQRDDLESHRMREALVASEQKITATIQRAAIDHERSALQSANAQLRAKLALAQTDLERAQSQNKTLLAHTAAGDNLRRYVSTSMNDLDEVLDDLKSIRDETKAKLLRYDDVVAPKRKI